MSAKRTPDIFPLISRFVYASLRIHEAFLRNDLSQRFASVVVVPDNVRFHLRQAGSVDVQNWPTRDDPFHPTNQPAEHPRFSRVEVTRCFESRIVPPISGIEDTAYGTGKPGMQY